LIDGPNRLAIHAADPRGLRPVHPVEHPANDKSRRLWFAFLVAPASRRSSPAEKSLRTAP
jgi:hypothetical protein